MRIPYVIDNREHRLADVLNELLRRFESRSMDIASAFFSIRGFQLLQDGLENIGSLRLLLGTRDTLTCVPEMGTIEPIMGTELPDDSIAAALFGKTRRAVLGLLYTHPDESFYVRQVVRSAGVGQGAVQRELSRLAAAGIIERERDGRQVYYRANRACPVFEELHALMVKTAGLADVLRQALEPLADAISGAFVYGSVAGGQETARSDVDVMVIGEASFGDVVQALRPAEEALGREVNPTVYPPAEFKAKLASEHHFVTTVLKGPKIFLIGSEHDLAGLAEE